MSGIHVHQLPRWCASCGYRLTSHSTDLCRPCRAWQALTDDDRARRLQRSLAVTDSRRRKAGRTRP